MATATKGRDKSVEEFMKAGLKGDRWLETPEIIARLEGSECFGPKFKSEALRHAKAAYVHRMINRIKDEDGWREWASVTRTGSDGKTIRVYKSVECFSRDDFIEVIDYHRGQANHHRGVMKRYERLMNERFPQRKAKVPA